MPEDLLLPDAILKIAGQDISKSSLTESTYIQKILTINNEEISFLKWLIPKSGPGEQLVLSRALRNIQHRLLLQSLQKSAQKKF